MAELWELDWNRLPLGEAVNVREMGGYPTKDGGRTNYHRYLRACVLSSITPEEQDFLYKYGVRCMIDLRGSVEHDADPDPSLGPDVEMHHVPLYEANIADLENVDINVIYGGDDPTITDIYRQIIEEGKANICRVFKIMAAAPEGVVLFNCTAGKDRTGLIAFLLLMLAGADKYDCIANYVPSGTQIRRWKGVRDFYESPSVTANAIAQLESVYSTGDYVYDLIENGYGGAESYLLSTGVTVEELKAVRDRLVG